VLEHDESHGAFRLNRRRSGLQSEPVQARPGLPAARLDRETFRCRSWRSGLGQFFRSHRMPPDSRCSLWVRVLHPAAAASSRPAARALVFASPPRSLRTCSAALPNFSDAIPKFARALGVRVEDLFTEKTSLPRAQRTSRQGQRLQTKGQLASAVLAARFQVNSCLGSRGRRVSCHRWGTKPASTEQDHAEASGLFRFTQSKIPGVSFASSNGGSRPYARTAETTNSCRPRKTSTSPVSSQPRTQRRAARG